MKAFHIGLYLLFSIFLAAQSSGVKGIILDGESNEPLIGASVTNGSNGKTTSIDGSFQLDLEKGSYLLKISYVGFETQENDIVVMDGQYTDVAYKLFPTARVLDVATVTGSKHQKSIARSPVSISIVKPQLLDNTNTTRISSLLDKIPGVQIKDNQANIRGGSGWSFGAGSRVLLLIDDIPALQADAGRPSWGDIPVENISQIEVLKGAASTMYGSSALNGIVNIRTGYATSEPVTKVAVGYLSYMSPKDKAKKWWTVAPNKLNMSLLHKQKFGNLDLVANVYYEDFDSYYEGAFEEKKRASANLKYRVNDRISLGLNTMVNIGEAADYFLWRNGGAGIYKGLDGTLSARNFQRYYVDPQITIFDKKDNRHKIFGRYYYINNDNNNSQGNSSKTTYGEYQFLKSLSKLDLNITAGAVGQFVTTDSELLQDANVTHNNFAQYFELDKRVGEKFTVTAGLRHEYNIQKSIELEGGKDSESKIISRLGLNYQLGRGTFLRSSWGQGYRYPTIVERFIVTQFGGFFVFPNPTLKSEFGWSSEFGVKQGFKFGEFKGYLDASVFWSQYSDMTEFSLEEQEGKFGFQSQNVGATDIKGIEFELISSSQILGTEVNIIAGYTYINPQYQNFEENEAVQASISIPVGETEKQNILKYRNKHNFKIDIESTKNRFSVGAAVNLTSVTSTIDQLLGTVGQIRLYRLANPEGYAKLDARISYKLSFAKLSILSENILNDEYADRPGLLEAPRSIGMRLDFEI